jgi:DNA-binding MarR family transcriptional regulator
LTARASQVGPVGQTCRTAVDGRRAAKVLAQWSAPFQLTEPELQILWCLDESAANGVDQTTLATRLAFSPAQVSACVEKLRARGLISQFEVPGDRRRRLWRCSASGSEVLKKIVQAACVSREAAA